MRIQLRDEKRIFEGTAAQVVQQMQRTAIFAAHLTLDQYVDWCVRNAGLMGFHVKVTGESSDERCASLLDQMLLMGFAERL